MALTATEIPEKTCSKCETPKPASEFNRLQKSPDGLNHYCKQCRHLKHLADWSIHAEKRKAASNIRASKNRPRNRQLCREWHAKNRDKVLARQRRDRERCRVARNEYAKQRRALNPRVRVAMNISRRIRDALKGHGKAARTEALIGCSISELRLHLEKLFRAGMTWENYGPVWHIDHRRPCASFDLTDADQQRECFHFTNLQPLFARENLAKSATYTDPDSGVTIYFRKLGNQYTHGLA